MKKPLAFFMTLMGCLFFTLTAYGDNPPILDEIYIAIIIDDFGNHDKDVDNLLNTLTIPITGAVIPGQPSSVKHMEALIAKGHDVIIHMPMEAKNQRKSWTTPLTLLTSLSNEQVQERVLTAYEELPLAMGINNHTGSKATADLRIMEQVISLANDHNLLVIDSLTSDKSKVAEVCERLHLNFFRRDVFLDKEGVSLDFVQKRMQATLEEAQKKGYAIAIGHVGPSGGKNTLQGINNLVSSFEGQGVKFVTISELHQLVHGGELIREPLNEEMP